MGLVELTPFAVGFHGSKFVRPDDYARNSRFYLENLEFWGTVGGFEAFVAMIQGKESAAADSLATEGGSIQFAEVQQVLRVVYTIKDHIQPQFLGRYVPILADAVSFWVKSSSTNDLTNISRDIILEVVHVLELLLAQGEVEDSEEAQIAEGTEDGYGNLSISAALVQKKLHVLRLDILMMFFCSSSLEKRIFGFSEIIGLVTRLYNEQVQEQEEPTAESLGQALSFLVNWIDREQLVGKLFGESIHTELVKRSTPLFQFASELEYLTPEWLDHVWMCYHGNGVDQSGDEQADNTRSIQRHGALRSVTHSLLLDLADFIDLGLLEHLLYRLQRVRAQEFDETHLMLLSCIARRKMQTQDGSEVFPLLAPALFHLWDVILPHSLNPRVVDQVILQISDTLAQVFAESGAANEEIGPSRLVAGRLLSRALEKIRVFEDSVVSLQLVTQLAQLIQEQRLSIMQAESDEGSVIESVLSEMNEFKKKSLAVLEASCPSWTSMSDSERKTLPVLSGYLEGVKIRLHALKGAWILDKLQGESIEPFDQAHTETLWNLLVLNAIQADEASLCFQWIMFCIKSTSQSASYSAGLEFLSLDASLSLMNDKFSSLPPHLMSVSALTCFQALFTRVNLSNGSLQTYSIETKASKKLNILEWAESINASVDLITSVDELAALDVLWYLTLNATDSKVAEECLTLLVGCYLDVAPNLRDPASILQIKRKFILRCMTQLRVSKRELLQQPRQDKLDATRMINRCLDLLRYFLETSKEFHSSSNSDAEHDIVEEDGQQSNQIDSLEERLPFLGVYPSPMKDALADYTDRMVFGTARRPSWTFQHQHFPMLEAIPDDIDRGDSSGLTVREGEVSLKPLEIYASDPQRVTDIRSPTVRQRPNLHSASSPSPQRGPSLSIEEINSALTIDVNAAADKETGAQSKGIPKYPTGRSKYCAITHVLANEGDHFEELLELVDVDDSGIARRAWELLCLLPTNNTLLHQMIQLRPAEGVQDVEWERLLSSSSHHRLLYSLRQVEALLIPLAKSIEPAVFSTDMARRQWRERFVRLGGAHHLYSMFVQQQVSLSELSVDKGVDVYCRNLRAACLAGVMRCLNYFLELPMVSEITQTEPKFDTRLMHVTLPKFMESIDYFLMFQAAARAITTSCISNVEDLSSDLEETVIIGCNLCCSLIRSSPQMIVWDGGKFADSGNEDSKSGVVYNLMRAILVVCAQARLREKAVLLLVGLSNYARGSSGSTSLRLFMAKMTIALCVLVVSITREGENSTELELDQLTQLSCQLLSHWADSCGPELLFVVDGLLKNLYSHATSRSLRPTMTQKTGVLACLLKLITAITEHSAISKEAIQQWAPIEQTDCSNWIQDILIDKLVFSEAALCQLSFSLSASELDAAQNLAAGLLYFHGGDTQTVQKQTLDDLEHLILRQRQFHSKVIKELVRMGRPWNYTPHDSLKSEAECAGLNNPGCVCYMNSLLQQLFMMPGFFSGLLRLDCSETSSSQQLEWIDEVKELQRLFVSLSCSKKRACDPTHFALSHRDLDGNPTDLHTQMDADEFFCMLLDRLETFIASKRRAKNGDTSKDDVALGSNTTHPSNDAASANVIEHHFLNECFGGVLVNQILTKNGNLSEREERFFALSLEITKKHHLADSLSLYVQGEPLDGENAYFCEREQRKVSATKRICIKKAPKTLVCHLKRFNFDFDTMEKMKINDYLEFPTEIDISPYTAEGVENSETAVCMYDLVGIVVHSGTSDAGHYYSFIKDRKGTEKWFEFNDEIVRPFDEESMAEECFGGEEVRQRWDPSQAAFVPVMEMKRRSAYMLIYEHRSVVDQQKDPESAALMPIWTIKDPSPNVASLIEDMASENYSIDTVVHAFSSAYEQFLCSIMRSVLSFNAGISDELTRVAYQCSCEYLFGIYILRSPANTALTDGAMVSEVSVIADDVANWLSTTPVTEEGEYQRSVFCSWFVDTATSLLSEETTEEHARSWLFDALVLTNSGSESVACCLRILKSVLEFMVSSLAISVDGESMLSRTVTLALSVLELLFVRHSKLIVRDPISNGPVAVSISKMRQAAIGVADLLHQVVHMLPARLETEEASSSCRQTLAFVFITQADMISRFFASLEIMVDLAVLDPQRKLRLKSISSNTSEYYEANELSQLHLCALGTEIEIILTLLEYREKAETSSGHVLTLDLDTLYRSSVVKGLVLSGCGDLLKHFIQQITSVGTESECDRIITPVLTALEDFRDTPHAGDVFAVVDAIIENSCAKDAIRECHVLESIFSPSRGVLEAAIYYKERIAEKKHTLALLRLFIRHLSRSFILQQLITENQVWSSRVQWVVDWITSTVDPALEIRSDTRPQDFGADSTSLSEYVEPMSRETAASLFVAIENGFNTTIFIREAAASPEEPQMNDEELAETGKGKQKETEGNSDENQSEMTSAPNDIPKGILAHEQPENEEQDSVEQMSDGVSRNQPTSGSRATPPMRLRLDLDAAFINYSEA